MIPPGCCIVADTISSRGGVRRSWAVPETVTGTPEDDAVSAATAPSGARFSGSGSASLDGTGYMC